MAGHERDGERERGFAAQNRAALSPEIVSMAHNAALAGTPYAPIHQHSLGAPPGASGNFRLPESQIALSLPRDLTRPPSVFAPPSPFSKNVQCVRETEILVEQQPPQGS